MRAGDMHRTAVMAVTGVLAFSGVNAATGSVRTPGTVLTSTEVGRTAPEIAWAGCAGTDLRAAGARCGLLTVPLDHAAPSGTKIKIAVSRIRAEGAESKRQGVLLVNPGGPGGSGLTLPVFFARTLPAKARAAYDLIGFDTRGVGASKPALTCDKNVTDGPRPDYVPATAAVGPNERAWLKIAKDYASACAHKHPRLIRHMSTADTIRDLELLRRALGEKQINFYGFSYGTYIAQTYATRYPTRMRRMVLDGDVDPAGAGYGDGARAQSIAFERVIQEYFAWVAKYHSTYRLGRTAEKVEINYYAQEDALRVAPVGPIGPSEWSDVFLFAGYSETNWPYVTHAWVSWLQGERGPVEAIHNADAPGDNGYAAFNATVCSDGPWPSKYSTIRRATLVTARDAPFEAWSSQWFSAPCLTWKGGHGKPLGVDGAKVASALLVNATLDGATPFAGALTVRREFPRSSLIAEVGSTTHAGSLSGNACVDDRVVRYLMTGKRPARLSGNRADVRCGHLAKPRPLAADRSAALAAASAR